MFASTSIWVRLYYQGKAEPNGNPIEIEPIPKNVGALTKAVKEELKPKIDYAPVHEIYIYPPGTKVTALDGGPDKDPYKPGKKLAELIEELKGKTPPISIDDDNPLIVVAPAAPQPQTTLKKDDEDRLTEMLVSHWSDSKLIAGKRLRETETVLEARKKQAIDVAPTTTNDDQTMQAAGKTSVQIFQPKQGFRWYMGEKDEAFYLRACVHVLLSLVLNDMEKVSNGPILYVISGASGIGKSWSINAFMAALLGAEKKVFFHMAATGRAWKIEDGEKVEGCRPSNITALEKQWVYVYDSPGSKSKSDGGVLSTAFNRTGSGEVTLVFSSPKAQNYEFAVAKGGGLKKFFNLPTWKKEEMLEVEKVKASNGEAFNACYDIWGGNMRAMNEFLQHYQVTGDVQQVSELAEKELDLHIERINKDFAQKMTKKLEKQEVEKQFTGVAIGNTPGHILVPEPTITDPRLDDLFTEFSWRFCSPLAEKKFWKHAKTLDHDALKQLLINVFQVPSPKGVLFEKVAHTLITNGVVKKFRCYPYNKMNNVTEISFQQCSEAVSFDTGELKDKLRLALQALDGKTGAIALEPKDTSFDAVDMFLLEKRGNTATRAEDWSLHLLQDTIAKKHSFHPVKVLWYCSLFCDAFKEVFSESPLPSDRDLLKCCKYVPLVPHSETKFSFKRPTSNAAWEELECVKSLLDFEWPDGFSSCSKDSMKDLVATKGLEIPPTAKGQPRQLTKTVVGNALLLDDATKKVELQCSVIFDVVNTLGKE